jgi:hypothetical protein
MTSDALASAASQDYLEDTAVAAYFASREHEAYYRSLKSADERRGFHDRLTEALTRFVEECQGGEISRLDMIIGRAARADAVMEAGIGDPAATARSLEPRGFELLQLDPVRADFDSLRDAYRRAALQHHPDRGGTNADMTAINTAYEILHAALAGRAEDGDETLFATGTRTAADYLYVTTRLLFEVALDDWALDQASALLEQAVVDRLPPTTFDTPNELISAIPPASKLCERLVAAGMQADALRALHIAEQGLTFAKKRGLRYDGMVAQAREVMDGARKPRFVLNHRRQIENAHRLGAIDDRRYETNLGRVGDKSAQAEEDRATRRRLLDTIRFTSELPIDLSAKLPRGRVDGLVPQPDHFQVRIEELSPAQQVEYLYAFTPPYELSLIEKYAFVRISGLLRSAIFCVGCDAQALGADAHHLAALHPKATWCAERAERILKLFSALPAPERAAYANELAALLEPPSTTVGFLTITMPHPAPELGGRFLDAAIAAGRRRMHA